VLGEGACACLCVCAGGQGRCWGGALGCVCVCVLGVKGVCWGCVGGVCDVGWMLPLANIAPKPYPLTSGGIYIVSNIAD
jgi:hypothetical protein